MATIRRPTPEEAPILTDLAIAAKAYWGYSDDFMAAARAELTITAKDVRENDVHVAVFPPAAAAAAGTESTESTAKGEEQIAGVYCITATPSSSGEFDGELSYLWVHPRRIRTGVGSLLWHDAMRRAADRGMRRLSVDADPNAEGFYLKKGAEKYGEVPSKSIAGRMLPLLRVDVEAVLALQAEPGQ